MLALAFATHKEMQAALSPFGPPPAVDEGAWARVALPARDVLALVTGVSVVKAALGLGRLLEAENVTGLLNLGIAGSYDTDALSLGSVAVATGEAWPEYGLLSARGADARALGWPLHPDCAGPASRLDLDPDTAAAVLGLHPDPAWTRAESLTVSSVTATSRRAGSLRRRYGALTENMEGHALALGCRRAGIPFLEVRAVSNAVGPRRTGSWNLVLALASLGKAARRLLRAGEDKP